MFVNDTFCRRLVAGATAVMFLATALGCHSYQTVPLTQADIEARYLPSRDVRATMKDGTVFEFHVQSAEFPIVTGWKSQPDGSKVPVSIDLHEVELFEVNALDGVDTVLVVLAVLAGVFLVLVAIAGALWSGIFIPGR